MVPVQLFIIPLTGQGHLSSQVLIESGAEEELPLTLLDIGEGAGCLVILLQKTVKALEIKESAYIN